MTGSETIWQAEQIASGIARIEAGTTGEYVPQSLNYDLTGHISFTKGCYTGQEVVARLHYRGKSKRRLYLADINPDALPAGLQIQAGDPLYGEDNSRAIGNVINWVQCDNGERHLLVTTTEGGVNAPLRLRDNEGPLLHTSATPYSIPQ